MVRLQAKREALSAATLLVISVLLVACSGPRSSLPSGLPLEAEDRTLTLVVRGEPDTVAAKEITRMAGLGFNTVPRLFNAGLVILDGQEVPRPYLAQEPPQLQSDSWRVSADGRMETTYRLRPNLTWHDGAALSAEDFVFAWRVYSTRQFGQLGLEPMNEIEEVTAPDARTLTIRWSHLYPKAATLDAERFQALPRHRLEDTFRESQLEAFARLPFWTTEYVGLGPYKLIHWETGSFLDAAGFEGHAWGRPRIAKIRVLFMSDANAVLATLQAGEAHVAVDDALRFRQGAILKHEWSAKDGGTVIVNPGPWRRTEVQHRLDYASPRSILDVRVRRALAHSLDRAALNEGLFEGEATLADSFVPPTVEYFPFVDRVVAKYPHDPRRAEKLMAEAGFSKASDGVYVHPIEGRFSGEIRVNATAQAETEVNLIAEGWRRTGFELREVPVPPAQSRVGEVRGAFPTLYTLGGSVGEQALATFASSRISRAENRWTGSNRGGWSSTEYDRIFETFERSLDRTERTGHIAEMAKLVTHHVAAISLYFNPGIVAHTAAVQGPQAYAPASDAGWNIHLWEWR